MFITIIRVIMITIRTVINRWWGEEQEDGWFWTVGPERPFNPNKYSFICKLSYMHLGYHHPLSHLYCLVALDDLRLAHFGWDFFFAKIFHQDGNLAIRLAHIDHLHHHHHGRHHRHRCHPH